MSLSFLGVTALSAWSGLKVEADHITEKIMYDAGGFVPHKLHGALEWISKAVAYLTVFLGYIILSHITVWVWRWFWCFV